jgi:hypothetical protein
MEPKNDNPSGEDLLTTLAQVTEDKNPGNGNNIISSDFWDQKDPEETTTEKSKKTEEKNNPEKTKNPAVTEDPAENKPERPKKLDREVKEASARTLVGMMNFTQKLIFTPIINYKFKKKFSDEEIEKLDAGVEDKNKDELDGEDLALRNKWDRLMRKRDKKIQGIPFDEGEEKDLHTACFNYMDIKEKELPPEYFLALTAATIIGKRAIDAFFD